MNNKTKQPESKFSLNSEAESRAIKIKQSDQSERAEIDQTANKLNSINLSSPGSQEKKQNNRKLRSLRKPVQNEAKEHSDESHDSREAENSSQKNNNNIPAPTPLQPQNHETARSSDEEDGDVHIDQRIPSTIKPAAKLLRPEDIGDKRNFLISPIPKGYIMEATIKRDKSGFGVFYPRYDVYLSEGYKYLMSGKRRAGNTTSNYLISADKNDLEPKGPNYLGKVRANFMGTEFHVFDSGCSPDKPEAGRSLRKTLATVYYESNFFGTKGPRKMEAYIPDNDKTVSQNTDLKEAYAANTGSAFKLVNKEPKWNEQLKAFVLNFNGRVDKPSVKNFILIRVGDQETNVLLFGRTGQDIFTMDVQYPMSPIQAFGIALSSFDYKIACQ